MRALTVQQPWAWAIVHGGKDVENRGRNLAGSYRGPVAIHAGKREDEDGYYDDMIREVLGRYDDSWLLEEQLGVRGAIVGVADLVGVHHDHQHGTDRCSPWSQWGQWHLVLENPRPLELPISCRGALGLWTPAAEVLAELEMELSAAAAADEPDDQASDGGEQRDPDEQDDQELGGADAAHGQSVHGRDGTR